MPKLTLPISPWEGFSPTHTELHHDTLTIHLTPTSPGRCRCGQVVSQIHDVTPRTIQEREAFGFQTLLSVPLRRLRCPNCGVVTESLSWLEPHARQTNRLIRYVERLLKLMPI
ncbi:transposase family protein, partial [Ferrimonas sp.]|uniref:transposase family protein n=1 Tax=Ferrimonas sp. TaxID=2080861 RepID=UPI003A8E04FD